MSIQTIKQGTLEYLVAEEISVPHAFTTRLGGVSTGSQASLNLAVGRGDSEENVEQTCGFCPLLWDMTPVNMC